MQASLKAFSGPTAFRLSAKPGIDLAGPGGTSGKSLAGRLFSGGSLRSRKGLGWRNSTHRESGEFRSGIL